MTHRTGKVVTALMALVLVMAIGLTACGGGVQTVTPPPTSSPTPTPTATATPEATATPTPTTAPPPPTTKPLSYEAKTYTNTEYGFSVQYPKDWVEQPQLEGPVVVGAYGVQAFIPGFSVNVADASAPLTADWISAQMNSLPDTSQCKVTSGPTPATLGDGTPASQYVIKYTYQSYEIQAFGMSADKNGKRFNIYVWTIDAFAPYDEAKFSEIANTLAFK